MNKTKIEWCDSSWNPVTGCLHGCPYCYAERIANRFGGYSLESQIEDEHAPVLYEPLPDEAGADGFITLDAPLRHWSGAHGITNAPYPYWFRPTFHRYRLGEPARKEASQTIFVCSMADLFGRWVPTKWIVEVLDACLAAPQHRYLFLTKNPGRYIELDRLALLPREDNFWYGSTVTTSDDQMTWMRDVKCHWFVSIEPLLGGIDITAGDVPYMPEWIIIGAETGNRAGKVIPEKAWVDKIVADCRANGIPVFMKNSLAEIAGDSFMTEFPWGGGAGRE